MLIGAGLTVPSQGTVPGSMRVLGRTPQTACIIHSFPHAAGAGADGAAAPQAAVPIGVRADGRGACRALPSVASVQPRTWARLPDS